MVAGTGTGRGGHSDLQNGRHASVEPHHGGRRPARHAVEEPTRRRQEVCGPGRPAPWTLSGCRPAASGADSTSQRHEHAVPKSDCRPRRPVASVGEENLCPWWCSGSIRTSSPIRPPPWPPGHSNRSAAFGSSPAPPAMSSCWAGPDSSRNGAGRSRTPADWAAISPSGCSLVGRPSRTCAPPPPHGSGSCRAGVAARPTCWMRPPRPGSRPCRATPPSCSQTTPPSCWRCWRSGAATWSANAPAASTSSMPSCASLSPAVPHLSSAPTRPPRCSARSDP